MFPIKLDTYALGGLYLFGDEDAKLRPYIGLGMGITRLVPEPADLEAETRFSASIAGGVKTTWVPTSASASSYAASSRSSTARAASSAPGGACLVSTTGSDLSQAEIRGGLIFRF